MILKHQYSICKKYISLNDRIIIESFLSRNFMNPTDK
jgi:hypothetical protein